MLVKARYEKLEDIPEFARGEFEQRTDGSWYLKLDAIEGGPEHLNPGLAANRDALRTEKDTAVRAKSDVEAKLAEAERQLAATRTPGSRILGGEDAKLWDRFTQLGSITEVAKMVKEYPEIKKKLDLHSQESTWRAAAKNGSLNYDVLSEILSSERGQGLSIVNKKVEETDPNDSSKKITVERPFFIKREKTEDGNTFREVETSVLDYATANFPAWMVNALKTGNGEGTGEGDSQSAGENSKSADESGVRLPNLGGGSGGSGTKKTGAIDNDAIVKQYNERRNMRVNPLAPPAATSTGQQTGGGEASRGLK